MKIELLSMKLMINTNIGKQLEKNIPTQKMKEQFMKNGQRKQELNMKKVRNITKKQKKSMKRNRIGLIKKNHTLMIYLPMMKMIEIDLSY